MTAQTKQKALVTGGSGFIGSHLCESLLAKGWEVYALDDLFTGSLDNVEHLRGNRDFHLVIDSVLSAAVVNELVHKCDVVYHLAAAVGVRLIVEQPVKTLVTNVQGTEVVLDHCNRFAKRVLVASTSEVYGDQREELPLEESARRIYGPTTTRRWAYADSKAMDEFLALAYHQERTAARFLESATEVGGADAEEFLSSLEATLTVRVSREPNPRAFELINKTNQFNLNGSVTPRPSGSRSSRLRTPSC